MFYRVGQATRALASLSLSVLALFSFSCTRRPAEPRIQRLAILRFENLGADVSTDWMGRALSDIITVELSGVPDVYAIPAARLLVGML